MKKIILFTILLVSICLLIFSLYRLDKMEIKASDIKDITFSSGKNTLAGSLYLPNTQEPHKVVVFIHGDGAADRTLQGGYNFIINHLLHSGYAVLSYDKAGVGASSGNWLEQSMKDRAEEVLQAIPTIQESIQTEAIGVLAFSQGGWVTSELALADAPLDFYIVAGGAIDWMDQHLYYETGYAKSQGFSAAETQKYLDYIKKSDAFVVANDYAGYQKYVKSYEYGQPMSQERFNFAYINHTANATKGIVKIHAPFLGLFGEEDINVDVQSSISVYEKIFKENGKTNYKLYLLKDANHELLDSKYNKNNDIVTLDAFLYGEKIFADGALDTLTSWLDDVTIK